MTAPARTRRAGSSRPRRQLSRRADAASVDDGHISSERFVEIQRARLLAAAVGAIDELGYADTSVADITTRARVSRRTFYELFPDREACLLRVIDDIVGLISTELAAAELGPLPWRDRTRRGLHTILAFLDREPLLARVCVVQALRGGPRVLARREELLARLAAAIDEGRLRGARGERCSQLLAEGLVGAAFAIVHARLLRGEHESLTSLLGELMGMILLPYEGSAAAERERRRPPTAATRGAARHRLHEAGVADPLGGVEMRLTYRTARVLEGIAAHPGSSNREAGRHAGILDPGQISKLLARLERLGLLVRQSPERVRGEPNAWTLTPSGEHVARSIRRHGFSTGGAGTGAGEPAR